MAILSKECKPDNFELHNSLKVSLQIFKVFIGMLLNVNLSSKTNYYIKTRSKNLRRNLFDSFIKITIYCVSNF